MDVLNIFGAEVETFGFQTGWDLTDKYQQRALVKLMDSVEPDEIWIYPMRGPWKTVAAIDKVIDDYRVEYVRRLRQVHHIHVLMCVDCVFNKQLKVVEFFKWFIPGLRNNGALLP